MGKGKLKGRVEKKVEAEVAKKEAVRTKATEEAGIGEVKTVEVVAGEGFRVMEIPDGSPLFKVVKEGSGERVGEYANKRDAEDAVKGMNA